METILVMLSGGLDSTYLLYHYLKNTNYNVHAHHVILKSKTELRWRHEKKASEDVVEYCKKNVRQFKYTFNTWGWGSVRNIIKDISLVSVIAALIVREVSGDKIYLATGRVADDNERPESYNLYESDEAGVLWRTVFDARQLNKKIEPIIQRPLVDMSKRDLINNMPKKLFEMTWSCRTPNNGKPCGVCHACKDLKNSLN